MCQSLGWTWEEADEQLDIPRLKTLTAYWRTSPPTHIAAAIIAGALGVRFDAAASAESSSGAKDDTSAIFDKLFPDGPQDHG